MGVLALCWYALILINKSDLRSDLRMYVSVVFCRLLVYNGNILLMVGRNNKCRVKEQI